MARAHSQPEHDRAERHVHPDLHDFYFCITWLPTYLLERHGFNISGMALFAGLPLLVSIPGDLLGGWLTDRLSSRSDSASAAAAWEPSHTSSSACA